MGSESLSYKGLAGARSVTGISAVCFSPESCLLPGAILLPGSGLLVCPGPTLLTCSSSRDVGQGPPLVFPLCPAQHLVQSRVY